jgi:hypothetical protein
VYGAVAPLGLRILPSRDDDDDAAICDDNAATCGDCASPFAPIVLRMTMEKGMEPGEVPRGVGEEGVGSRNVGDCGKKRSSGCGSEFMLYR